MIIRENESLAKHTTFKTGGTAEKYYIPEDVHELVGLVSAYPELYKHIISGGSNLLINDQTAFTAVLSMEKANVTTRRIAEGEYYAGASVRIQELINTVNRDGFGGIEYLYSLPAMLGGIIFMNAGRGKSHDQSISDHILKVEALIDGEIRTLNKEECQFGYRTSVFQRLDNCIILGATLKFDKVSQDISSQRIKERIDLCKEKQDSSAPNFGSVFCVSDRVIMKLVKKIGLGKKNGCHFSKKTQNWILKGENGTFEEAIGLINKVMKIHKLFGRNCKVEVQVWK